MTIGYDIGFREKLVLTELDQFMKELGFQFLRETQKWGLTTKCYILNNDSVPREIRFIYREDVNGARDFFAENADEIKAYGNLETSTIMPTYSDLDERLRIIKEKGVKTQHDYYRHLEPERLKFYETALALRDHYKAIVRTQETGEEINPEQPFPNETPIGKA